MFQSDDDITFDAEFLSDTFELASSATSVECSKRHSEDPEPQLAKKSCSSSENTLDILSLLKSRAKNQDEHRFARPVLPNKKRRVVQRKFPGPAGILPAQRDVNVNLDNLQNNDSSRNDDRCDSDELLCSQQSDDIFSRPAWRRMLRDLGSIPGGVGLPERYTIAWAKARASRKQLDGGRTPFLAAVVQQIDCSTRNPMAMLKDQTGEIQATLIHELWQEYNEHLHTGAVILLRQVGVLSTAKQHYLTVTLNNLFAIYSDGTAATSGSPPVPAAPAVTTVNHMSSRDFIKTLADVRSAAKMAEAAAGLFSGALKTGRHDDVGSATRSNTHTAVTHSLGLFSTAEGSAEHLQCDTRRDTHIRHDDVSSAARSNTHTAATNSLGLFTTAERSSKHLQCDNEPRRDTHNSSLALFSTAKHSLNTPKFTTDSRAHSITSETPTFLHSDFNKTTQKSSMISQESELLSQILDGLDTESIFDDF